MEQCQQMLYLVRHGATEANLRSPPVLQGQGVDLPLCDSGRLQAARAATALEPYPIRAVYSSPLRRAKETAKAIALPHQLPVQLVAELVECDVGRWEGLSWEQVRRDDRSAWDEYHASPGTAPYAGGESYQQVQQRIVPALDQLLHTHTAGELVVVTHNVVARCYIAHLMQLPISRAHTIRLDNAGISLITMAENSPRLVTLNAILHLRGLPCDGPPSAPKHHGEAQG